MSTKWKQWLAPLAMIVLSSWYFATSYNPNLIPNAGSNPNERQFTVNGLITQPGSASTTDPAPRYRIYLFPGDGTFTFGTTPVGQPFVYAYTYPASAPSYTVFAEATYEYGDEDLPPMRTQTPSITGITGTATGSIGRLNLGVSPFLITPVRKVVPDHKLTYVVTFENPNTSTCPVIPSGTVEFTFDHSKLKWGTTDNNDLYYNSGNKYQGLSQVSPGKLQWTFTNLNRGEQRNVFLRFQAETPLNGAVAGATINPAPTVAFAPGQSWVEGCGINTRAFVLSEHSVVSAAHDPNQKTISPADFCVEDQDFFDFMVTFQNDGFAPVQTIHIEDELDVLLANCCTPMPISLQEWHPRTGGMSIVQTCAGGKFNVTLQNINLPGNRQPGYGLLFGEHETKGYIKFRVPKSCLGDRPPCSAICNQASILFDCNPPLETNVALSRINCNLPPDSCGTCLETVDTLAAWLDPTVGDSMFFNASSTGTGGGWPGVNLSEYTHFKWYPATGLSNALVSNPTLTEARTRTYTLVASGACKRLILYLPVVRPCALTLNLAQTMTLVGCTPQYDLTLTANAGALGINPATLEWQNCDKGGSWTATGLPPGHYYFSVKDPATGCYAEQWVELPGQAFQVTDDSTDCVGHPVINGGTGPYQYLWTWHESNVLAPFTANGITNLPLAGKTNVVLTVTDAQGCQVVVPIRSKCLSGPFSWLNLGWIAGLLVAMLAVVLGRRFWRSRRRL